MQKQADRPRYFGKFFSGIIVEDIPDFEIADDFEDGAGVILWCGEEGFELKAGTPIWIARSSGDWFIVLGENFALEVVEPLAIKYLKSNRDSDGRVVYDKKGASLFRKFFL